MTDLLLKNLVPPGGNDPPTLALSRRCSTTELRGQCMAGAIGFEPMHVGIKIRCLDQLGEAPTVNKDCSG